MDNFYQKRDNWRQINVKINAKNVKNVTCDVKGKAYNLL
jgi:hypothetical protein